VLEENDYPVDNEDSQKYRKENPGKLLFEETREIKDEGEEHPCKRYNKEDLFRGGHLPYPEYAPPHGISITQIPSL
jgi:hypothetical protein